ncbi:MAG: endolytic transglycosylase MltG [Thermodesulfobacteriota bacterium]|nr:endolytic transglycosylase MltG [Thermodesulfobacteriota bacterium]
MAEGFHIKFQKNIKHMKQFLCALGIIVVLTGLVTSVAAWKLIKYTQTPLNNTRADIPSPQWTSFSIKPGESLFQISKNLEKQEIITSCVMFRIYARIKGQAKKIKAGEYRLSSAMPPRAVLDKIVNGRVATYRLTIPEGLNIKGIARLVERAGFGTQEMFQAAAHDKTLVQDMGISADSCEGYLFPETYFFPKHTPTESIIRHMVHRFTTVFTKQWENRAEKLGFNRHEIVTLASIIEKETGTASERPIISSVFHNRLKKGMRLESDPTVIYGIPDFNGNITRKDLETKTPYNTYKINGLPPGPIAGPGKMALRAALFPADTEYLFFVSKKDTTHKFSKTFKAHNKAVRKYQLNR